MLNFFHSEAPQPSSSTSNPLREVLNQVLDAVVSIDHHNRVIFFQPCC